jgi:hypothetical protein|tara:strand:- start:326 stop:583 length:258 start_codon:yes stop_codon:yes gene_type:complete
MTKIIDIHTGVELEYPQKIFNVCSVCECSFCQEDEGGLVGGMIGILPVSFCPTCLNGVTDMVIQMEGFNDIDMLKERIEDLKEDE